MKPFFSHQKGSSISLKRCTHIIVNEKIICFCLGSVDLSFKRPLLGCFECTPWAFFRLMQNVVDTYCIL